VAIGIAERDVLVHDTGFLEIDDEGMSCLILVIALEFTLMFVLHTEWMTAVNGPFIPAKSIRGEIVQLIRQHSVGKHNTVVLSTTGI
jgi:hypothetical protein